MSFRERVVSQITVPYEKAVCRQIEGLEAVSVYFHGKAHPVRIFNDDEFDEELPYFLHYVGNASALMVEAAESFFGKTWPREIRVINGPDQETR